MSGSGARAGQEARSHPLWREGGDFVAPTPHYVVMIAPYLLHLFTPIARIGNEIAIFAYLDSAGRLLGTRHVLSERIDVIDVPIRRVAGDALAFGAEQVVMAHNPPSGDAEPSRDDLLATRRVAAALNTLEIRLVDHFVLAGDRITSLRCRGLL